MLKQLGKGVGKPAATLFAAAGLAIAAAGAHAQKEQFIPANFYWVGPYAPGGSGFGGGMIDYFAMLNERDGGINGVKLTWEKCETEYNNDRGVECYERSKKKGPTGATVIHPLSTGITYSLIEKATDGQDPDHLDGLRPHRRRRRPRLPVHLPADHQLLVAEHRQDQVHRPEGRRDGQAEGQEDREPLSRLGLRQGDDRRSSTCRRRSTASRSTHIAVPHPGNEQQSQWLQIRQFKPDWVILRGWGVMNPTALKAAAKVGYPREKMLGVWWSGAEEDVIPAGDCGQGLHRRGVQPARHELPGDAGHPEARLRQGQGRDGRQVAHRLDLPHPRHRAPASSPTEAIRTAQARFGKGKPMTGEQMRWGLENLNIDEKRLKELGAVGLMQPLKVSCMDHEGGGAVKFQQWDGNSGR